MSIHIIEGHAIVSREGAIANAAGTMPGGLKVEADWVYFQRQLDESALTVLGRASHEASPNPGRRRLVITSRADGLEQLDDLTWVLDPASMGVGQALERIVPQGGRIAVVGGRGVFDLFLKVGFDLFHLTIARQCRIYRGIPVFGGVTDSAGAMAILRDHGLAERETTLLDREADAVLHVFARAEPD